MSSARTAAATWWSNTARTENSRSPDQEHEAASGKDGIPFQRRKRKGSQDEKGKYWWMRKQSECDFMSRQKPSAKKCPQCGGYMLEKGNKLVCADEQCGYVEAREKKDED